MDLDRLRAAAESWIADDPDPVTQQELRALLAKPDLNAGDLEDRFAGALGFGTAGLRGILGAGPNRMNRAVVARATWGLAQVLAAKGQGSKERGVVVGADARRMSPEFSQDVAAILGAAGFRVMLFTEGVPTPFVGFAVRHLHAAAGVVITASHNPPAYNGYKVYWGNSAQIIPPIDAEIAAAIGRAPAAREIDRPDLQAMRQQGRVIDTPAEVERAYLDAVLALAVHPTLGTRSLRIVYTPMHGVGGALAHKVFEEAGFSAVTTVPEQSQPEGAFPTVAFPNPQEPGAMDLALALAKKSQAELVLANDPDADRLGVAAPDAAHYRQLTGNQVGALLSHYLLTEPRDAEGGGAAPPTHARKPRAVMASIVSTPLVGRMAADLGAYYEETLTGFKWIANRAIELERDGYDFVFGFEEALGYCVGNAVRDKDGISAALLFAEMAAVLRARGRTIWNELEALARRWGFFASVQVDLVPAGPNASQAIDAMMNSLRARPPHSVAGDEVVGVADYLARTRTQMGKTAALALPSSNVLTLELGSGSRIIARPSGTEPKAKLYFDVREDVSASEKVGAAETRALANIEHLTKAFREIAKV